ncbi:MAG: SGNH/GDSL hydrolase family protein [Clostridia bacterium]|nr:SGNH/GDSL hydrolase family protein [Clostridia bacterium]
MKILFQGDSVTDAGRDRSNIHDMGESYPKYASAMIADAFPDTEFEFVNLGISGNRTEHLVQRLQSDFIDIQPDIVSIMIGINDVWHHYMADHGIETTDEAFEQNYRTVLTAIKEKTHAKILIIEPYLLYTPDKEIFRPEFDRKIAIVRKLAREFADRYLPTDGLFAAASVLEPPTYYSPDGVHPNAEGACFIGERYLEAITPLIEELKED